MSDGSVSDRLSQLKARWESDPTSRIFLQLAEEYRHQGRMRDALAVLDKGLGEHPGYLSALVAKGRCHLELGEGAAARTALERVVKQDPTQMVANKLLVRAYLETGEPERARERLDLYSLLNDSDPEIGDLRRQIKLMDRPKEPQAAEDSPFDLGPALPPLPPPIPALSSLPEMAPLPDLPPDIPAAPPARSTPATPAAPVSDDIFDLGLGFGGGAAPAAPRRPPQDEDIFGFEEPAPRPAPAASAPAPSRPPEPDIFDLPAAPRAATTQAAEATEPGEGDDLFPELSARSYRHRYLEGLESEGIFELGPVAEPASEVPPPAAVPAAFALPPLAPPDLTPVEPPLPEPAPVLDDPFDLAPAPPAAAVEEAPWIEEPAPAPEPEPVFEAAAEPVLETAPEPEPVFGDLSGPVLPEIDESADPDWSPPASEEPEPPATVTLAELYLRQGHTAEAERIFREVLDREPGNTAARAGLDQLAPEPEPEPEPAAPAFEAPVFEAPPEPLPAAAALDAGQLLAGYQPGGGTTARKIYLLNRYLERIRGSRHVS